jgi:hypothetical protein
MSPGPNYPGEDAGVCRRPAVVRVLSFALLVAMLAAGG